MSSLSTFTRDSFSALNFDKKLPGDIVVFSHLRWEFVTQRPQHILSRLAKKNRVLFVEEPIAGEADQYGKAKAFSPLSGVTVVQPYISSLDNGFQLAELVDFYAKEESLNPKIGWFYSPSFVEVLKFLSYETVVYDCMDELTKFNGADPDLAEKEKILLSKADVVFTGGKSLYESKSTQHSDVFCFPSSVDKHHFEQARRQPEDKPEDLQRIPGPIVGFYGVIDERIDYELLNTVTKRLPQLSFVMIGPVVKVDPDQLPKSSNLWYLGGKNYNELPIYLSYMDVAMMPFAKNNATQFISPTKTLEFLAAHKPVISTPITDVVRDYSSVVTIATTPEEFAFRTVSILNETEDERRKRISKSESLVRATSWDETVRKMSEIINRMHQQKYKDDRISAPSFSIPMPSQFITSSPLDSLIQ